MSHHAAPSRSRQSSGGSDVMQEESDAAEILLSLASLGNKNCQQTAQDRSAQGYRYTPVNSLVSGRCSNNFKSAIFKLIIAKS